MKLKSLLIDRRKWYRGRGGWNSRLRLRSGKMCCLGFLGVQCGIAPKELEGVPLPSDIRFRGTWPPMLFQLQDEIVFVNDSLAISEAEREQALRINFKQLGYRVKFTSSRKKGHGRKAR